MPKMPRREFYQGLVATIDAMKDADAKAAAGEPSELSEAGHVTVRRSGYKFVFTPTPAKADETP